MRRRRAIPADWRDDLAPVVRPWAAKARRELDAALAGLPDAAVDRARVRSGVFSAVTRRLVTVTAPVLFHELHRLRDIGALADADGRPRFTSFVRRHAEPAGAEDLTGRYPGSRGRWTGSAP